MNKDHGVLMEDLLSRRYDETLQESIVSDAFKQSAYPEVVKYALESMEEVDPTYSYKTFHITKGIQEKLEEAFQRARMDVAFRYQGPIQMQTHVVLYGDVEMLVVSESIDSKPWLRIRQMAQEIMEVLTKEPDLHEVDYSNKLDIKLATGNPRCRIKILPVVWIDNPEYMSSKREIDRGICEYNLEKKTRKSYLPFRNIARVNSKDTHCKGGLKRLIRFLRNLQQDASKTINLNSSEISGIPFSIPEEELVYDPKRPLQLLARLQTQMERIVSDREFRENMRSPSHKELVFGKSKSKLIELEKFNNELVEVIADITEVLAEKNLDLNSELSY